MCIRDRGKTTTIGKLARQFEQQGKSVMLAAGDTFRAAAVEPVSYTHLDVYKRQQQTAPPVGPRKRSAAGRYFRHSVRYFPRWRLRLTWPTSVSYTHLDVYKRQRESRAVPTFGVIK